ncbi:hypothetical protein BKA62DRAFT_655911 [Auriculariales sp. MPI-PUGE-AT-0066]|nr:hypothetical protein BKA62DRAFT_655911 [Auriculariales sp. MPI-PUGE-AT-0066]
MGAFVWHEWAQLVATTASVYGVWSAYYGIFYRKVFWDFIGGTLRAPGGLQPSAAIVPLTNIIVRMPLIQLVSFFVCMVVLAIELPAPGFKSMSARFGWVPRIAMLLIQAVLTALYYQGTNAAIWSVIAAFGYAMAQMNGEKRADGKGGRVGRSAA